MLPMTCTLGRVISQGVGTITMIRCSRVGKGTVKVLLFTGFMVVVGKAFKILLHYARRYVGPYVQSVLFAICSRSIPDVYRNAFRSMPIVEGKVSQNHSHPQAAMGRTSANVAMDDFIHSVGAIPYSVSMSQRDVRNGNHGSRLYHFSKDLAMNIRMDKICHNHYIKMVDVDYYCHMPDYMAYSKPIILYTFNPMDVAGVVPNGTYTIQDNKVNVKVNGGAEYEHAIWDYDADSIVSDHWWGSTVFLVEHRVMSDQTRRIVGLFPVRKVYTPLSWLIPGKRMERRKFQAGQINLSRYQLTVDGVTEVRCSLGLPGERTCSVLPERAMRTALIRCGISKNPSISDVERIFREASVVNPTYAASLFIQAWLTDRTSLGWLPTMQSVGSYGGDGFSYQTTKPLVTEDGQPSVRQIAPAICTGGVAPARSYNNDVACVEGRVEAVKNHLPSSRMPPFYKKCRQEFLEMLIPENLVGTGVPWEEKQVEDQQTRPTQRALAEAAKPFAFLHRFLVKSFQKAEVYAKVCAPRNISTTPTDHKLRYSAYIYALKQVTKQNRWYAFSKTPLELVDEIKRVAENAEFLTPTDFSKWDGTHSEFLCEFERMALRRYFAPTYHSEVVKLYDDQYDAPAITKNGVRYNTGKTRLSGSAETSEFNTDDNALVAYIALRHIIQSPRDAWDALGLYGGDDGLTGNVTPVLYEKVASRLGHSLKAEVKRPGDVVPFLGRLFVDPWTSGESFCDVARRLKGIHLTTAPKNIPDAIVLRRKAMSYLITDSTTPVVSHWSRAVLRIVPNDSTELSELQECQVARDLSWFAQFQEQFTLPQPDCEVMWNTIANDLKMTVDEVSQLCGIFDSAQTLDQLAPKQIIELDGKVEVAAAVGGQLLLPPAPAGGGTKRPSIDIPKKRRSMLATGKGRNVERPGRRGLKTSGDGGRA